MDMDVVVLAQVMTVIISSLAVLVGIALVARALWRKGSRTRPPEASVLDEARVRRLENAVDTIAVEVERISEAQRFAAGLLADRLPPRAPERAADAGIPGTAKRVNTPH